MRVHLRGNAATLQTSASFSTSGIIHATLLALVVFGNTAPVERPRSIYDQVIRPNEKRIIWYHLQEGLPEVRPPSPSGESRPLRATRKFEQRIVAGARDDSRPPQIVWAPPPDVAPPKAMPLPNVLAVEMKRPVRPFTPPEEKTRRTAEPVLPDAPKVPVAAAPAGPSLEALRKTFTPPPVKPASAATPTLPDAPGMAVAAAPAGPSLQTLRKTFTPPVVRAAGSVTPVLPDAPGAAVAAAPAGPSLQPLVKSFTPPPLKGAAGQIPAIPEAEGFQAALAPAPAGPGLQPLRKTFALPSSKAGARDSAPAPELPAIQTPQAGEVVHLAIIGLDPSKTPDIPAPPAPRTAGFSAGPKPQPAGAESDGAAAGIVAPGVTVRDGAASRQSLIAAIRPMSRPIPTGPPPGAPLPTRVTGAPDPSLEGRTVYTLAIQMPNVTSYSGSWIVWFAERERNDAGTVRAPSPVRKVDPKYIASAVADDVQGIVRLAAVIRKDGHVDSVTLLRHLDDRLDRSAMESLAKWEFEPALRNGAPVDVDAVFEIPFRLAPKPLK